MASFWTTHPFSGEYPVDLRIESLIVGEARVMLRLKQAIATIAPSDAPVLVRGPTGAGKELVAKAIHTLSGREGPLIPVNCGAIPQELLESELFGHEKGAFTGAQARRIGLIEQAQGGTLFLDEIGDMPAAVQVKLLRAIETRTIQRVGGGTPIEVNFRLVSATHKNLHTEALQGRFREDLLFRIDVFSLNMPALRDHASDIPLILRAMAQATPEARLLDLSPDAIRLLASHEWPGNVRELRNFHDRAQVLFKGRPITADDINSTLLPHFKPRAAEVPEGAIQPAAGFKEELTEKGSIDLRGTLQRIEEKMILSALELCEGSVTQTAEMLRLKRTTLIGRMQKLGIAGA